MSYKNVKSKRAAEYKQKLYEKGLCTWCGKPRDRKGRLCSSCQKKNNALVKEKSKARLTRGLCRKCDTPRMPGSNLYCLKHWLQKICIDRTGSVENWEIIASKLEQQNHTCPYSGRPIKLGENAQLDHIVPIELGGTNDPDNLEWIDAEVNRIKGKRSKSGFINICKTISLRHD